MASWLAHATGIDWKWGEGPATTKGGWADWLMGSSERGEAERKIGELLGAKEYEGFGATEAGKELRTSLEAQVESQYKEQLKGGLGRAAHTAQGRGMMSSSVLPGLQLEAQRMASQQRGMGMSQVGQTMGGLESAHMQQWRQQELAKSMQAAQYWQKSGEAAGSRFGDILGMVTQLYGTYKSAKIMG